MSQTLVDILEEITEAASNSIVGYAHVIDDALGDRPYGRKFVPERAQVRRYTMIRDDQDAWKRMLDQHGLGPTLEYALRLEKMRVRYPDEDLSDLHETVGRLSENQMAPTPPELPPDPNA